jgi:hypothetical protein
MALKKYDPKAVSVIFGGPITGFADGTFVNVAFNEDLFNLVIGADGEACRSKTNNLSARITITLLQSSASNTFLSAAHNVDLNSPLGDGIVPFFLKDLSGDTIMAAENAWVVKPADTEYAREPGSREWTIETDNMQFNVGGNL